MALIRKCLSIIIFLGACLTTTAQDPTAVPKENEQANDTTKAFVFSSYRFDENNQKIFVPLDTVFGMDQQYTPLLKITPSWTQQTNYGQAVRSNEYFRRNERSDFIFWRPYEAYWPLGDDTQYFNLNSPYTNITFSKAQKTSGNEQIIKVLHTRNFSDRFNVGARYNVISTPGIDGHRNRAKHSRFSAFLSYTGLRYQLHANGSSTKIETQHNGGFLEGSYYFHKDSLRLNLTTAGEKLHDFHINAEQEFLIGPKDSIKYKDGPSKAVVKAWASLRHKVEYRSNYRVYNDSKLNKVENESAHYNFYPDAFLNKSLTFDSLHYKQIKNKIELEVKEGFVPRVNFGLRGGIVHEYNDVYNFRDYIFQNKNISQFQSWGVVGSIFNRVSDYWAWKANGHLYMEGYRQGDLSVKGEINRYFFTKTDSSFIQLRGEMYRQRPNFLFNTFYSNHYMWENDFNKEESIKGSLHYIAPQWKLDVGIDAQEVTNFIYIDGNGRPAQNSDNMLTWAASLRKNFLFFRHLGFDNVLIYQKTSNENILHIPKWISYQALYYDRSFFKDAMRLQIGADFTMTARFKGAYFNPAVGMYQLQHEKRVGQYPIISAYANMRVRNARLFFKFYNVYQYFTEEWHFTSAYTVDTYSMFRFGVNWYFSD